MKKTILTSLIALFLVISSDTQAANLPNKEQFLAFWTQFKNAIKNNDADYLFAHMEFPFQSEGAYYNEEASLEDIKENYKEVLPPYRREMEFVRFDIIMVEEANAYVWLGYSIEDDAYFYCLKLMSTTKDTNTPTYEEKYWFKLVNGKFLFYRTSLGIE